MKKRGQVTLFIIVGLVLVAVIGLVFFMISSKSRDVVKERDIEIRGGEDVLDSITLDIEECISEYGEEAIELAYVYGGYLAKEENSVEVKSREINLLCYDDNDGMINVFVPEENLEQDIGDYVKRSVVDCVNLDYYRSLGYAVDEGIPNSDVEVGSNRISISLNWPISVSKENFFGEIKDYSVSFNYGLSSLYAIVEDFVKEEVVDEFTGLELVEYRMGVGPNIRLERDDTTQFLSIYNLTYYKEDISFYFGCRRAE